MRSHFEGLKPDDREIIYRRGNSPSHSEFGHKQTIGLDGLTAEFFKKSWNIIKRILWLCSKIFSKNGIINARLNEI